MRDFSLGAAGHLADASERKVAELARSAMELGGLSELERLSEALAWLKGNRIRTAADLTFKGVGSPDMATHVQKLGILKKGNAERRPAPRPTKPSSRTQGVGAQRNSGAERANEHRHTRQRDEGRESQR